MSRCEESRKKRKQVELQWVWWMIYIRLRGRNKRRESELVFGLELGDEEQWWNNMVVAELGVTEKKPQESPPQAWPDEDDGDGGEQPISSPPRGDSTGTYKAFSQRRARPVMRNVGVYLSRWMPRRV